MNKTVLITYIYPNALKFINEFKATVNSQLYKDFDIYIFNDGICNVHEHLKGFHQNVILKDITADKINKVRYKSFDILKKTEYEFFIFQDIDDGMTPNRIECLVEKLKSNFIVCNDLTLMKNESISKESVWSERLNNNFTFQRDFIKDKNILGLGNTGVVKSIINKSIKKDEDINIVDWFVFYQWMDDSVIALFTNECQTLYRQHEENIAGATHILDLESVNRTIKVKEQQYKSLTNIGYDLTEELIHIENIKKKISNRSKLNIKLNTTPFWWEETNVYEENTIR
ncbi:MAG: hypothetical protein Q8O88_01690 [bacterium]|nr:hypothetical protein [bacterium]